MRRSFQSSLLFLLCTLLAFTAAIAAAATATASADGVGIGGGGDVLGHRMRHTIRITDNGVDDSDALVPTITCNYSFVLRSTEGGRMFAVAPSKVYNSRFRAAVAADLWESIFAVETREVHSTPSSSSSSSSSLGSSSPDALTDTGSGRGRGKGGGRTIAVDNTTTTTTAEVVARGKLFDRFFHAVTRRDDTAIGISLTCPPPSAMASPDVITPDDNSTDNSNSNDTVSNDDHGDTSSGSLIHIGPGLTAGNSVTVRRLTKRFNEQLSLIAVEVSVTTNLFSIDGVTRQTQRQSTIPSSNTTARNDDDDNDDDDGIKTVAKKDNGGGDGEYCNYYTDTTGNSSISPTSGSRGRDLRYCFCIPSSRFDTYLAGQFFVSLTRRRSGQSGLDTATTCFFPALAISGLEAILGGGATTTTTTATTTTTTTATVTHIALATSAIGGDGDGSGSIPPNTPPPQQQRQPEEDDEDAESVATRYRTLAITSLYSDYTRAANGSLAGDTCAGFTCALGIFCFLTILALVIGGSLPFLCGRCVRNRREKKDAERLRFHELRQQQYQQQS